MSPSDRSGHLPWSRPRVPARTLAAPGNAVLMRALLVGAMAAATAASMIAPRAAVRRLSEIRLCIRCWHDRNDGTIALLPFAADDVMLPGERRQLLLTTMSQIRALERACNEDLGCFGQLLLREIAEPGESLHEPLVPLLQIMEIRNPSDPGGVAGAVWTEVKCAGIARLDTPPSALLKDGHRFLWAKASVEPDEKAAGGAESLKVRALAVRAAQGACLAKEQQLVLRGTRLREPARMANAAASRAEGSLTRPSYGPGSHHVRAQLNATLDNIVTARREALLQNGLDEAPSQSLRDLQAGAVRH